MYYKHLRLQVFCWLELNIGMMHNVTSLSLFQKGSLVHPSLVFRAQKMPDLTENNRDRSKEDQFQIRESLLMKDR